MTPWQIPTKSSAVPKSERNVTTGHRFNARNARMPGGSPCTSSTRSSGEAGRGHVVQEVGQRHVPCAGQPAHAVPEPGRVEVQRPVPVSGRDEDAVVGGVGVRADEARVRAGVHEPAAVGKDTGALPEDRVQPVDVGVGERRDDGFEDAVGEWQRGRVGLKQRLGEPARAGVGHAQLIRGKIDAGGRPPGVGERGDEPSATAADIEAPARSRAEQAQSRGDGLPEKLATAGRSDQVSYQSARPS